MEEWAEADFHRWADLADIRRTCRVTKMRKLAKADFHRWADLGDLGRTGRMAKMREWADQESDETQKVPDISAFLHDISIDKLVTNPQSA